MSTAACGSGTASFGAGAGSHSLYSLASLQSPARGAHAGSTSEAGGCLAGVSASLVVLGDAEVVSQDALSPATSAMRDASIRGGNSWGGGRPASAFLSPAAAVAAAGGGAGTAGRRLGPARASSSPGGVEGTFDDAAAPSFVPAASAPYLANGGSGGGTLPAAAIVLGRGPQARAPRWEPPLQPFTSESPLPSIADCPGSGHSSTPAVADAAGGAASACNARPSSSLGPDDVPPVGAKGQAPRLSIRVPGEMEEVYRLTGTACLIREAREGCMSLRNMHALAHMHVHDTPTNTSLDLCHQPVWPYPAGSTARHPSTSAHAAQRTHAGGLPVPPGSSWFSLLPRPQPPPSPASPTPHPHRAPLLATTGATGSSMYMAPEVTLHQPYNASADVFSFGMLCYEAWSRSTLAVSHIGTKRPDVSWPRLSVCKLDEAGCGV